MTGFALTEKLVNVADAVAESRTAQISDEALRAWIEEVRADRARLTQQDPLVGYEATCLVECLAALAFARSARDRNAEARALCYINSLRVFMRGDLIRAQRELAS